jgi:hypothetical protein
MTLTTVRATRSSPMHLNHDEKDLVLAFGLTPAAILQWWIHREYGLYIGLYGNASLYYIIGWVWRPQV